jgi:hypothetical protein
MVEVGGSQHDGRCGTQPLWMAEVEEADTHLVGSGMWGVPDIDTKGAAEGSRSTAQEHQRDCEATAAAHIRDAVGSEGKGLEDRDTAEEWAERSAKDRGFRQGGHE